jgi:hypothetical protein
MCFFFSTAFNWKYSCKQRVLWTCVLGHTPFPRECCEVTLTVLFALSLLLCCSPYARGNWLLTRAVWCRERVVSVNFTSWRHSWWLHRITYYINNILSNNILLERVLVSFIWLCFFRCKYKIFVTSSRVLPFLYGAHSRCFPLDPPNHFLVNVLRNLIYCGQF